MTIDANGSSLNFEYSLSDPRIEVSSRDTTKAWMRFNQYAEEKLNKFLGIDASSELSRSMKGR